MGMRSIRQLLAQEGEVVLSGRVEGTALPTRLTLLVFPQTRLRVPTLQSNGQDLSCHSLLQVTLTMRIQLLRSMISHLLYRCSS